MVTFTRFFVERRAIAWVLLAATLCWGYLAYRDIPHRRDPTVRPLTGVVVAEYPGANAEKVELDVTRAVEHCLSASPAVERVRSVSSHALSTVFVELREHTRNPDAAWGDLRARLAALQDLPRVDDRVVRPELDATYGQHVAVALTIAGPPTANMEVQLRAESVRAAIDQSRASVAPEFSARRVSAVIVYPEAVARGVAIRYARSLMRLLAEAGISRDSRIVEAPTTACVDFQLNGSDAQLIEVTRRWKDLIDAPGNAHADIWPPVIVRGTETLYDELRAVARDKYTYRKLAEYTGVLADELRRKPDVAGVDAVGAQREVVTLLAPGNRLSQFGLSPREVARRVQARNANLPSGRIDLPGQTIVAPPAGEFRSERDIGDVVMAVSSDGYPLYLRDLADISRGYVDPPDVSVLRSFKAALSRPPLDATTTRPAPVIEPLATARAITLAIRQTARSSAAVFDAQVNDAIEAAHRLLPDDLRIDRTADEPREIEAVNDDLGRGVIESIAIVTLVVLLLTPWREAVVVSLSIPLSLAITIGSGQLLGLEAQQVSLAGLIITTGLFVIAPLLVTHGIARALADGEPRDIAARLGAHRVLRGGWLAIIAAALGFASILLIGAQAGAFAWSFPIIAVVGLGASWFVAATFVPLMSYYLLSANGRAGTLGAKQATIDRGIERLAQSVIGLAIAARWVVVPICLATLAIAAWRLAAIPTAFFNAARQNVFTIDIDLQENATARQTQKVADQVARDIDAGERASVHSFTTYVGSDGPSFYRAPLPGDHRPNHARMFVQVNRGADTSALVARLRRTLPFKFPDARLTIAELGVGPPLDAQVEVRLFGSDEATLRQLAAQAQSLIRGVAGVDNVRDDWGQPVLQTTMSIDLDRVPTSDVSPQDIGSLLATSLSGLPVTRLREGGRLVDVVLRLPPEDRGRTEDLLSLTAHGQNGKSRVPLRQIVRLEPGLVTPRIVRRTGERCVTISADVIAPTPPARVAESVEAAMRRITLPPGYRWESAGESEPRHEAFDAALRGLAITLAVTYLLLLLRFNHVLMPIAMFTGVPFAIAAALVALQPLDASLGFVVLLAALPLAGVSVMYAIIAFSDAGAQLERGATPREAIIASASAHLRVAIASALACAAGALPLALRGGPTWGTMSWVWIAGVLAAAAAAALTPVIAVILAEDFPRLLTGRSSQGPSA